MGDSAHTNHHTSLGSWEWHIVLKNGRRNIHVKQKISTEVDRAFVKYGIDFYEEKKAVKFPPVHNLGDNRLQKQTPTY